MLAAVHWRQSSIFPSLSLFVCMQSCLCTEQLACKSVIPWMEQLDPGLIAVFWVALLENNWYSNAPITPIKATVVSGCDSFSMEAGIDRVTVGDAAQVTRATRGSREKLNFMQMKHNLRWESQSANLSKGFLESPTFSRGLCVFAYGDGKRKSKYHA